MSVYYGYHKSLFFRPQNTHAWRQSDCASITLNYYRHGMNFFKPEVHNLTSDGGTTGYSATSEIPLLYYFSAVLYKVFGPHEFFIRLINMLIFFLGLFHLFKLFYFLWKDFFWATALSLLFFTSPVLIYYGNSFLSNVSGFSLAIIGIYYFTLYSYKSEKKFLFLSLLFFLLAGSFKVTSLMLLIAIVAFLILESLFGKGKNKFQIFKHKKIFISGVSLIFLLVGGWILYADYYNDKHDCFYFSTSIFPIWGLSLTEISDFIKHIWKIWVGEYFNPTVHSLFFILLIYIFFNIKKANRFHLIVLFVLMLESIAYISLQFWTFHDHDYYTIEQNIVPMMILITAFGILFKHNSKIFNSLVTKALFTCFFIFNVIYAHSKLDERINGWQGNYFIEKNDIYSITPYLREIGLKSDDRVIYIPDFTNVSLYLMDQPGWTQYTDKRLNRGTPVKYNQDSTGIAASIDRGAKYLIVNDYSDIYLNPYIKSFTKKLLGNYGSVLIFDLKDSTQNFSIVDPVMMDSLYFQLDSNQSINSSSPYGKTLVYNDCKYGERFLVSVKRKGLNSAGIIAGGPAESKFYLSHNQTKSEGEWADLEMEFFIPKRMEGKELKIYTYNPSDGDAFFKDFIIKRYNSALNINEN